MKKRLFALLLALAMVFGYMPAIPAMAEEEGGVDALTIYYTNDVHTYIKDMTAVDESTGELSDPNAMSYATLAKLKKDKEEAGEDVLLVDAGDHIQGTAYGGMDKGAHIVQFMNAAGYDLATLGNHEFDYGMQGALDTIAAANYSYVSANFLQDLDQDGSWEPVLKPYEIFEKSGKKYAFVGITTPETYTKSTPAYFQNEDGDYIYSIVRGQDGQELYDCVQSAIDAAYAEGADYVIAVGHLGVDASSHPWTSEDVIAHVTGLNAFIDGHSHNAIDCKEVMDQAGNPVILTQTGNYLDKIGQMTIGADGSIRAELITETAYDPEVNAMEKAWIAEIEAQLGQEIAESEIPFTIDYEDGNRAVRQAETNLSDLDADAYFYYINQVANLDCDVAFTNGGGVRANVAPGPWTYETAKTVNPFGNVLCLMEVPGQMILDALEWGARFGKTKENGGFLHTAGLIYKIDDSIPDTVPTDDKGVWNGAPEEYRVFDVKVYNKETGAYEDLDVEKTYTIGGTNYTLRNQGDGFNMFQEADGMNLVMEGICEDYMALSTYVAAFVDTDGNGLANLATANSPLIKYPGYLMNYESLTGAGRIVYESKPLVDPEPEPEPEPEIVELASAKKVKAKALTPNSIEVSWKAVKGAESYDVWYAVVGDKDGWTQVNTCETSCIIKKLEADTEYKLYVVAKRGEDAGPYSERVDVKTFKKLSAPKLTATLATYKSVKLAWPKVASAGSYQISYKKASASSWKIKTTSKTSMTITGLSTACKYQFKVVAIGENGNYKSKASQTKSVTTLKKLSAPKLTKNKNKVKVTFKNIAGESGYQISVSTKKTGTKIKATVKSSKATSKSLSVTKGKKLYYKVRAYALVDGKKVCGPWSAVAAYKFK